MTAETPPFFSVFRAIGEGLRRLLSFLLLVTFAFVTALVILGNNLTDTLLQTSALVNALDETNFADRSLPLFSDILRNTSIAENISSSERSLEIITWESIMKVIVPADWLEQNLAILVQSALDWLDSPEGQLPEFILDLAPIKQNLRGSEGVMAILPLLQGIPTCQVGTTELVFMDGNLVNCLPKGQDLTLISELAANIVADSLPDQVTIANLAHPNDSDPPILQSIYGTKVQFQFLNDALGFGFLISALLLSLYLLLQSKSLNRLIKSLPYPFYGTGLLLLVLFGSWYALLSWGSGLMLLVVRNGLSLESQVLLTDFIQVLGGYIQRTWLIWSAGLILFALIAQISGNQLVRYICSRSVPESESSQQHVSIRRRFH